MGFGNVLGKDGKPDGNIGPATSSAIILLQWHASIKITGEADMATMTIIHMRQVRAENAEKLYKLFLNLYK